MKHFYITSHARERLKERFNIDLTVELRKQFVEKLNDYPQFIGYDVDKNHKYVVIFRGKRIEVIVDAVPRRVLTVMYPKM